jgi:competence protein ComEC
LNDRSLVLLVSYRGFSALLTGDIEAAPQEMLLAGGLPDLDLLKVPHHGSKTSDTTFLAGVGAEVSVISAGADNRFGHPHQETLDALAGSHVFRTDREGRVVVSTNGDKIRVRTER